VEHPLRKSSREKEPIAGAIAARELLESHPDVRQLVAEASQGVSLTGVSNV
jgi:hypothetical protein